jgi:cyanamide hydratase
MSDGIGNDGHSANGWAAVPRDFAKSLADVDKNEHAEMTIRDANPPSTNIAKRTHEFAKEQLPEKTFNHSMRVWYYGKQSSRNHN